MKTPIKVKEDLEMIRSTLSSISLNYISIVLLSVFAFICRPVSFMVTRQLLKAIGTTCFFIYILRKRQSSDLSTTIEQLS